MTKKRCDWRLFIFVKKLKKIPKLGSIFQPPKKKKEKKRCGRPTDHNFSHPLDRKQTFLMGSLRPASGPIYSLYVLVYPIFSFICPICHILIISSNKSNNFSKLKKTMEIRPVGPTEDVHYVVKYNVRKQLKVNVIYMDHQKSCLFSNKGHISSPLWV